MAIPVRIVSGTAGGGCLAVVIVAVLLAWPLTKVPWPGMGDDGGIGLDGRLEALVTGYLASTIPEAVCNHESRALRRRLHHGRTSSRCDSSRSDVTEVETDPDYGAKIWGEGGVHYHELRTDDPPGVVTVVKEQGEWRIRSLSPELRRQKFGE